jgi:hypothetical protein
MGIPVANIPEVEKEARAPGPAAQRDVEPPRPVPTSLCVVRTLSELLAIDSAQITAVSYGLVIDLTSLLSVENPWQAVAELLAKTATVAQHLNQQDRRNDFVMVVGGSIDKLNESSALALRRSGVSIIQGEITDKLIAGYAQGFEAGRRFVHQRQSKKS